MRLERVCRPDREIAKRASKLIAMSTFEELARQNPNIRAQYEAWRQQRVDAGEDGARWVAFREHVIALGAPDPGDTPPEEWGYIEPPMRTFEELERANPNIRGQRAEWEKQRAESGLDAAWWPHFRQHLILLGAPDPGELPPEDWVGADYTQPTY